MRNAAAVLARPDTRALRRVMIAVVPRFAEPGREFYEKGRRPSLDRLQP